MDKPGLFYFEYIHKTDVDYAQSDRHPESRLRRERVFKILNRTLPCLNLTTLIRK